MEFDKQIQEINIDTIKNLSWIEKGQILLTRKEWLKKQRLQDKKDLRRQEKRKHDFKWTREGLCPNCKEHDIIFRTKLCLKCYGKILKIGRKRRKKNKKKKDF
jgi:hypothetical protein